MIVVEHQRLQCPGLRWTCLAQKNNSGNDVNDGFERDDRVKTLKGPPNNPSGAGGALTVKPRCLSRARKGGSRVNNYGGKQWRELED